jgi:hypothetical protein
MADSMIPALRSLASRAYAQASFKSSMCSYVAITLPAAS